GLPREAVGHAEALEQLEREPQRQAHHSEVIPADPLDERRAAALDRIGPGLVERLTRGDVVGDHLGPERPGGDVGAVDGVPEAPPRRRAAPSGHEAGPAGAAHRSRVSVTGPSFTSSTPIIAPNSPVSTRLPPLRSRSSATNRWYSGIAASGGAAFTKLGRRPL